MNSTLKQLRDQQAAIESAILTADRVQRERQSLAWNAITADPNNWEWSIHPKAFGAVVSKRVRPDMVRAWAANGLSSFASDFQEPDRWFGMTYYRTSENILTHQGGGHMVLNDPMLCNDDEWAAIVAGNIPAKYIR